MIGLSTCRLGIRAMPFQKTSDAASTMLMIPYILAVAPCLIKRGRPSTLCYRMSCCGFPLSMMGRCTYVFAVMALAIVGRGSECVPLASSSTSTSVPFCAPESSGCFLKRTEMGDLWIPQERPAVFPNKTQSPTAAGFDSTTPCPSTSLRNTNIASQLIENQV